MVVHALRAYKKGAEYSAPFLGTISKLKGFYFVELEIYPLSIGVIPVSLIACTSACVYQQDGYCTLERASSCGVPCAESPCVNFVPRGTAVQQRRLQKRGQRLTDVADRNELQAIRGVQLSASAGWDQALCEPKTAYLTQPLAQRID